MKSQQDRTSRRFVKDFITQVEEHRVLQNLTVAELAAKVGVSRQYLYRILNGQHVPSLSIAQTIARELGLSLELISIK